MKSNGIFYGILVTFFVIMSFEVNLSEGKEDPSSEDAAEEEELKGPVDNFCFVCKARGQRRRRGSSGSVALQHCLAVSTSDDVQKVMCQHGCMAAYGIFRNSDESIERWCVGGTQLEQELIDLYAVVNTQRVVKKIDGNMYSCDSVIFDDSEIDGKAAKGKSRNGTISRGPKSYNFCWCRGNECNGRQVNGLIRAGASGRSGGGTGRILVTLAIALIFGLIFIPGSFGDDHDPNVKVKCSFCTEKTHKDCFEGGKDINVQYCDPVLQFTDSCIKMQTCVSGLPCEILRACEFKTIGPCLRASEVEVSAKECSKRKFLLNSPWGSTTFICLHSMKTYFERQVWKGEIIKPSSDFDDEDELKATKADGAIVEVEYCHCKSDGCNGGSGVKGSIGVIIGFVGFLAFLGGRHVGGGHSKSLITWLLIILGILTMVSCPSTPTPTSTEKIATENNITFDCFKCSNSKTSCYYSYLDECPSINIEVRDNLRNTKIQDKNCDKNGTRLCKVLTTQHVLGGAPKETEKGCLDPKELECFEETFNLTVPEGNCADKSMGYEEYTKWLRCNVEKKVKITSDYNEGVIKIMEQMKDFYGDEEKDEFFVRFCMCDAGKNETKGCNHSLN